MRLLLFSGNYPPEIGPNARIVGEMAAGMAARGHQVRVVTALPNHPEGVVHPAFRGRAFDVRREGAVEVARTWLLTGARTAPRRLVGAVTWGLTGLLAALAGPRPDVVLGLSTPYPAAVFGVLAARLLGVPHVFFVQDLYPETLEALGALPPWAAKPAYAFQDLQHRASALNLVIGEEFARRLRARGVGRVEVLPNWVDVDRFARGVPRERRQVLFAGTVGAAQGLDVLLDAARRLPSMGFWIVGEGVERARLQQEAPANVTFAPPVPSAEMPDLLASAEISVIALRADPVFDITLPCKTYELLASGRALAVSAGSAVRTLVEEAGAGLASPPGDGAALAANLQRLAEDPDLRRRFGQAGRRYADARCRMDAALDRLEGLLLRTVAGAVPSG